MEDKGREEEWMKVTFSSNSEQFQSLIRALIERPYHVAVGEMGLNLLPSQIELLCRSFTLIHEGAVDERQSEASPTFELAFSPFQIVRPHAWEALSLSLLRRQDGQNRCHILLGNPPSEAGAFTGVFLNEGNVLPVHSLKMVGVRMREFPAVDFAENKEKSLLLPEQMERFSRVIGALGEANWQTLTELSFCIIGVGRTGSLVATSLAKEGVRRLSFIDADLLELHNLDSMDAVCEGDIGRFKVEAVANNLQKEFPGITIAVLPQSVMTAEALMLLKEADVLICCVDNDAARLVAGALACVYAKPLLDIGTGIFRLEEQAEHFCSPLYEIGADVRLILPGEGCILCYGGVANLERAMALLQGETLHQNWREERAGSLRSLNQIAAHVGIGMLENLVTGRLRQSSWLRIEIDAQGVPRTRTLSPFLSANVCPLCAIMGMGDLL